MRIEKDEHNDERKPRARLARLRSRVEVGVYRVATRPWRYLRRGGQVAVGARKMAAVGVTVALISGGVGFFGGAGFERAGIEEQMEQERAYGHRVAEEANRDYDVCFARAVNWLEREEMPEPPARDNGALARDMPGLGKLSDEEYEACRQEQRAEVLRIEANSAELEADWQRRGEQQ